MMDPKILKAYCNYRRPPGPINVWRVVEKSMNKKIIKFSIQEIPEDRYDDVVNHMCTHFIGNELLTSKFKLKDNPNSYEEMRTLWKEIVKCGFCIVAFIDDPEGGKPLIAGVNMLSVSLKEDSSKLTNIAEAFKTKIMTAIIKTINEITSESNLDEIYGADNDKYLYGWGLSVSRSYQGMSLGGHLLSARDPLAQKYRIPVSITLFTSPASIKLAERDGYICLVSKNVNELINEKGELLFPENKSNCIKFMGKRFKH